MSGTAIAAGQVCPSAKKQPSFWLRKTVTGAVLAVAMLGTTPAFAKDPCKTALCMWGLFTGNNDSECNEAIRDYFDIIVYKKKKKVDWGKTMKARLGFTNSCPGSDSGFNKKVNDKFGSSFG